MRGLVETVVFGGAALALHLAAWPADRPEGATSSGGGGADLVTMAAASAAVARTVAEWDRPPAPAMDAPQALAAPDLPETAPPATMPDRVAALPRPPAPVATPALPQAMPRPEQPPSRPVAKRATPDTPRPAPRPDPNPEASVADPALAPSTAQVARRAAGEGGMARGQTGQARSATLSPARTRSLMAEWGAQIRTRIARAVPRGAGSGTAVVRLTVAADGGLIAVGLATSSGNPRIDALALEAVRRAGRFPAAPAPLGLDRQSFTLPVRSR